MARSKIWIGGAEDDSRYHRIVAEQAQEAASMWGMDCNYVAVSQDMVKDSYFKEDVNQKAEAMYKSVKVLTESQSQVAFKNQKNPFGYIGAMGAMLIFISKIDMEEITTEQNIARYPHMMDKNRPPKPGDIIIPNIRGYSNILEVVDVSDDDFQYLYERPYWILQVKNWTAKLIDWRIIENDVDYKKLVTLDGKHIMDKVEDTGKGYKKIDNLFDVGEKTDTDKRNQNNPHCNEKDNYPFGDW